MSQHASAGERVEIKPGAIDVTEEDEQVIFTVTDKESSFRIDLERIRFVCLHCIFQHCPVKIGNVTLECRIGKFRR